jgi:transcriptional regulator with XRE-family HTH domain
MKAAQFKDISIKQVRADLARNVKAIRQSRGLAQERLALEAGIDRTMLSKIEREVTNPSLETLLKLANYLNVSISELLVNK